MNRNQSAACVLVFAGLIGFSQLRGASVEPRPAGPGLSVRETSRDLGRVRPGESLVVDFPMRNRGGRRLVLNEDRCSACDGPAPTPPTIVVPPRDSAVLRVNLTAPAAGELRHQVRYFTNDPSRPVLELRIIGRVTAE